MSHYHAAGDVELDGFKPSKRYPNGACRCEQHIAAPLKSTRAVPQCNRECYMCERARILTARFKRLTVAV
jgi:hypothetical protein